MFAADVSLATMNPKTIKLISTKIYKQFPEVAGVQPKVRLQQITKPETKSPPAKGAYLLTYHAAVPGPNGKTMRHWVRVTCNTQGQILKISTSH